LDTAAPAAPAPRPSSWREGLARVQAALRGLRTSIVLHSKERYRRPWVVLLGEQGSGKSSIVASLSWVRDHPESKAAALPSVPMTAWHQLPQGWLIDVDGRASSAAAGTPQAADWIAALQGISAQRPERALDGVVLAVSARTLLSEDSTHRLQVAQDARRQLRDLRAQLGLVLPVYVVVTQSDVISGFAEYWRAFPDELRTRIQGWSAGSENAEPPPADTVGPAWHHMVRRLEALQVDAAAVRETVADADAFFLYPRHFELLQANAKNYIAEVFHDTGWNEAFLCRGIYFAGNVKPPPTPPQGARSDIAFVDDLVHRKVLAERGLARIARPSVWSRDVAIRTLQQAGIAAAIALSAALGAACWRLDRQADTLVQAMHRMRQTQNAAAAAVPCMAKDAIDTALGQATALDVKLASFTMPLSWLDGRPKDRVVRETADTVMAKTVYPALSCGLQARAQTLFNGLPEPGQPTLAGFTVQGSDYARVNATVRVQADAIRQLESNLREFDGLLAVPSERPDAKLRSLDALSRYLYKSPLPKDAMHGDGAVKLAIADVPYTQPVPLPTRMRANFSDKLLRLTRDLHRQLLVEVNTGPALLARLESESARGTAPVDDARHVAAWLTWVGKSWLPSDPNSNPCATDAAMLEKLLRPLVDIDGYPRTLLSQLDLFGSSACFQPAIAVLRATKIAPYGPIAIASGSTLRLNPELDAEVNGFGALLAQTYMQVAKPHTFSCVASAPGWRTVDVGRAESYAREFQQFTQSQQLAPLGAAPARQPLYWRVGRWQLELVMNDSMFAAQSPAGAPDIALGLDSVSAGDQQLVEQSDEFGRALQPLLTVARLYTQLGFAKSGSSVAQCVRSYASSGLSRASNLAVQSRLYVPEAGPPDGPLVKVGPTPAVRDYLARQSARAQVLTGYADPFASFLRNTDGVNDAQRDNTATLAYWTNTINQLNAYVQFKDPASQVGEIDTLFIKTISELTYENCAKQLAAYKPADYGYDLFSSRRLRLVEWLKGLCTNRQATLATEEWQRLAVRFNADLAGSYPFAPQDTLQEASLGTVKAFFIDYDANRAALQASLAGVDPVKWKSQLDFLAKLDKVSAFLRGSLTATPASQPIRLQIAFRAQPTPAAGSASEPPSLANQVVGWTLSAGSRVISYPGLTAPTLDWPFGQALELDLVWADRSVWRPVQTTAGGATASFATGGNWALLRMLDRYRPRLAPATDPADPTRALLELTVPVVRVDTQPASAAPLQAVLYVGVNMSTNDGKAPTPASVTWPGPFPNSAPAAPPVQPKGNTTTASR